MEDCSFAGGVEHALDHAGIEAQRGGAVAQRPASAGRVDEAGEPPGGGTVVEGQAVGLGLGPRATCIFHQRIGRAAHGLPGARAAAGAVIPPQAAVALGDVGEIRDGAAAAAGRLARTLVEQPAPAFPNAPLVGKIEL